MTANTNLPMGGRIIYISGIGADGRAFTKLDIQGEYEHVYTHWISFNASDSLESYVTRFIETYAITPQDVLVGLSFGGLIAQKISELVGNSKVVLVCSFRSKRDLRPLWHLCLRWKLYWLFPTFQIPLITPIVTISLNARSRESRQTTTAMLKDSDFRFIRWALKEIAVNDLSDTFKESFLILNGTRDLLVRTWQAKLTSIIKGGSHFMVFDRADQITPIIQEYLTD